MRKLLFGLIAAFSFTLCFVSCGYSAGEKSANDSTTVVTDSAAVDSIAADTLVVDSVK